MKTLKVLLELVKPKHTKFVVTYRNNYTIIIIKTLLN